MADDPETWTISLRAEGPGPPVEVRVRRALKWLLRSFGLRCTSVSAAKPATGSPNGTSGLGAPAAAQE